MLDKPPFTLRSVLARAAWDTAAAVGYGSLKRAVLSVILLVLTFLYFSPVVASQAMLDQADWVVAGIKALLTVGGAVFFWKLAQAPLAITNEFLAASLSEKTAEVTRLSAALETIRTEESGREQNVWAVIRFHETGLAYLSDERGVHGLVDLGLGLWRLTWSESFTDTTYEVRTTDEACAYQEERDRRSPDSIVFSLYPWREDRPPTAHLRVTATGPREMGRA